MRFLASCLILFAPLVAWSQDVPLTVKGGDIKIVKIDQITVVKVDRSVVTSFPFSVVAPPDEGFYDWILPSGVTATDKGDVLDILSAPKGDLTIRVKIRSALLDNGKIKYVTRFGSVAFSVGDVGPTPGPEPKPDPTPQPVVSFRVVLVNESANTLTGPQNSVFYGKTVEDFLNATCTGGRAGWRRRDKDAPGENDPTIAPIWDAVKNEFAAPKNTTTPAVVVQVNTRIEIIPLAATPTEMVAILKKYAEGK